MNISSVVETVIKKFTEDTPSIKEDISSNLEFRLLFNVDLSKPFKEAKKEFMRNYLNDVLTLSLGNISIAAKKAQLHRRHLHRMINALEINAEIHRRELLKPEEYLRENIYTILDRTLAQYADDQTKKIYSNLDDISEVIAKTIDMISYEDALELFEKEYITKALKENNYNISKTAEAIDMSERTLYRKMSKLNIATA